MLLKLGDYLKICSDFLKQKAALCEQLSRALDESRELARVVRVFEEEELSGQARSQSTSSAPATHRPPRGISLTMHLDAVHQNVVRYNLLMERYCKLLPARSEELDVANSGFTV